MQHNRQMSFLFMLLLASSALASWIECRFATRNNVARTSVAGVFQREEKEEPDVPSGIQAAYDAPLPDKYLIRPSRRSAIEQLGGLFSFLATVSGSVPFSAHADGIRQLELCLVSVLRTVYWAQGLSQRMKTAGLDEEEQKEAYLEARLGAKVALRASKSASVGSPPNPTAAQNMYVLSTLQLPACLQDLQAFYDTRSVFANTCREFYESLASLVEFDGMDTLQDPSPRSALFLAQWNEKKMRYIQRMLQERVVVLGLGIIDTFSTQAQDTSREYVQRYYPSEIPPPPPTPQHLPVWKDQKNDKDSPLSTENH